MPLPLDTTIDASELQVEAYRQMGMAGRLKIAFALSDFAHSLALAGIRERHPGISDEDAHRKLVELLYE